MNFIKNYVVKKVAIERKEMYIIIREKMAKFYTAKMGNILGTNKVSLKIMVETCRYVQAKTKCISRSKEECLKNMKI